LERDISHITSCTNNPSSMSPGEFATPTPPAWSNATPGAPVVNGSCKKIKQVQELQVDCGLNVVLNGARSLTKFMLDRDEDSAVANLKDAWQPPSSALPEVRQYRKQLVQHVTALPFGVGVGASTYTEHSFSK
jgi:hypothetical protein